jgi:hypothetical protein
MPYKYRILASHADAVPPSVPSRAPYLSKSKRSAGKSTYEAIEGSHEKYESKREKRGEKMLGKYGKKK